MSIPGLSLPGLSLANPDSQTSPDDAPTERYQNLNPETEFRFESSFTSPLTIKLVNGNAEFFGTELAPTTAYTFKGTKGAIFTWQGCRLEITGSSEGEYVAEETSMVQYANAHFALENARAEARGKQSLGPRVLVVGPENSGKTTLIKTLTAYAVNSERQPVVVNLDPQQALLSVPGALTASTFATLIDVEEGWGSSPISGPSTVPVKMPLCYQYGSRTVEENAAVYRALVTRLALAVTSRLEGDGEVKSSGCFIDTPGSISLGKRGSYEMIQHIVSEFSVNVILVVGGERLFSDMKMHFGNSSSGEAVTVVRLDRSGGCVERDDAYMRQLRQNQIREYFFGRGNQSLSPLTTQVDFSHLSIYRVVDSSRSAALFDPGMDDYDNSPGATIYDKVSPSLMLQNSLLAVTHAESHDSQAGIRDASVMGYVYVAEVDEGKKKVKLLSPMGGRVPAKAMVWGTWPEEVVGLVG